MSNKTVHVYPSPHLPEGRFLEGIGVDGAELPEAEAKDLIERGLATTTKPKSPAPPAEPEE